MIEASCNIGSMVILLSRFNISIVMSEDLFCINTIIEKKLKKKRKCGFFILNFGIYGLRPSLSSKNKRI